MRVFSHVPDVPQRENGGQSLSSSQAGPRFGSGDSAKGLAASRGLAASASPPGREGRRSGAVFRHGGGQAIVRVCSNGANADLVGAAVAVTCASIKIGQAVQRESHRVNNVHGDGQAIVRVRSNVATADLVEEAVAGSGTGRLGLAACRESQQQE